MAVYYVWSGAAGSANGSSWANAFLTLVAAFAAEASGDTLYVAHDHSELTAGAISLGGGFGASGPTMVVCVNRAGSVPPVSADRRTTAQVATSGNFNINFSGAAVYDGIIFIAGNSTGASSINLQLTGQVWSRYDNCSLRLGSTGAAGRITCTGGYAVVEMYNTTVSFSNVGQGINFGAKLRWLNTPSALIGSAVPTLLFIAGNNTADIECIGVDFSAAGSGKTIMNFSTIAVIARFVDCKLNSLVTKSAVPAITYNFFDFVRSAATGINYSIHMHRMQGLLIEETTIVRTGGASDGTTAIAWKVVTTANCYYLQPFECSPIAIWNDTTGSAVTATVEGIWGGGAVPNDDEVWVEVEYLGDASSPQGSFVNDGKVDLLATAAGQASSSATWGGSTTKFKLNVSFTAQQKGWIYARVRCAKASSTFYIDPLVTLT